MSVALPGSLVGSDSDGFGAFDKHGGVHEDSGDPDDPGEPFPESVVEKEVDAIIANGILILFVRVWCAGLFVVSASRLGRTPQPPGVGVAPPFRPTISLRAIVGLNGGLGLRGFLQTKIYTTRERLQTNRFSGHRRAQVLRNRLHGEARQPAHVGIMRAIIKES
jgi:hypothetical protein